MRSVETVDCNGGARRRETGRRSLAQTGRVMAGRVMTGTMLGLLLLCQPAVSKANSPSDAAQNWETLAWSLSIGWNVFFNGLPTLGLAASDTENLAWPVAGIAGAAIAGSLNASVLADAAANGCGNDAAWCALNGVMLAWSIGVEAWSIYRLVHRPHMDVDGWIEPLGISSRQLDLMMAVGGW